MTEKKFNFWFNIFILAGMITAVVIANIFELPKTEGSIIIPLIVGAGAIMGVINTVLSANGNIWTFFFGVIEVSICSFANFDSGNMGQFLQHVIYFLPMQFVGFWQWRKRGAGITASENGEIAKVRARRLTARQWAYAVAAFLIGTALAYGLLYWIEVGRLNAGHVSEIDRAKLLLDAAVVVFNIIGQILMSMAFAEQWYLWLLVNVFSILLWTNRLFSEAASSYTIVMVLKYVFYLLNSINGLRIWLHLSRTSSEPEIPLSHKTCC